MGQKTKDPPSFSLDKPYQQWKAEVKAWQYTVDQADKNKCALTIALSLPEKGCNDIRKRIFNTVNFYTTTGEGENRVEKISDTAYKDIIDFLDKEFAKDDIAELYDKTDTFLHTKKKDSETIKDFINRFDDNMSQAEKAGMGDISQGFKMCLFLKSSNLQDSDFKFVVSAIDYKQKTTLYPQAKDAMIKFFGSVRAAGQKSEDEGILDATDAMWSGGGGGYRGGGRGGYRGGGSRGRGGGRGPDDEYIVKSRFAGNIYGQEASQSQGHQNGNKSFRQLNPKKFGKVLKCHNCQAVTHLANKCPEANITLIGEQEDIQQLMELNARQEMEDEEKDYVGDISKALGNASITDANYTTCWAVTEVISTEVFQVNSRTKKVEEGGVLDTGCVATVGPRAWMNRRLARMSKKSREKVKIVPSGRVFRFGGGETAKSLGLYKIPVNVGGKNTILNIEVVDAPIPLLISKAAMKKAGAIIDTNKDTIQIFGREVKLKTVEAGHYAIQLDEWKEDADEVNEVMVGKTEEEEKQTDKAEVPKMWEKDKEKREKQILKVHQQMGHPSIKVFKRMLKISGDYSKEIDLYVNTLYESCVVCIKHGKGKTRPKICAPLSQEVNSTVAMDLKIWPKFNSIILYITCLFSRYTMGVVIPDKKPESVVKAFMDNWVLGFFGVPKHAVMVDNGGEFNNPQVKSMCEKLNLKLITTGALSPWQNGIVERNHSVVDQIILRMKEDNPKATIRELLRSALFAKNTMTNVAGFSSYQIVTGSNPKIPGVPYNDPPANEHETESEAMKKRLESMFKSREEYMKWENDNRLKKALNSRMAAPKLEHYETGEEVWYRHGKEGIWQGPASVIGQQNKLIYLRQGRFILAASNTNVKKSHPDEKREEEKEEKDDEGKEERKLRIRKKEKVVKIERNESDSDDSSDSDSDSTDSDDQDQSERVNEADANESHDSQASSPDADQTDQPRQSLDRAQAESPGSARESQAGTPEAARDMSPVASGSRESPLQTPEKAREGGDIDEELERELNREYIKLSPQIHKQAPKEKPFEYPEMKTGRLVRGDVIWARQLKDRSDPNAWHKFTIMVRTHKKCRYGETNHYGPHWNVLDENEVETGWYQDCWDWHLEGEARPDLIANYVNQDHDIVETCEHQEDDGTYVVFIPKEQIGQQFVLDAKAKEMNNFIVYKAFMEVVDEGQPRITMSWVITEKIYGTGEKGCKARLVVNGNQLEDSMPKDSPTVRKNTLRIMMALCVQNGWKMFNCDVTAAFLQSTFLMREVIVQPPKDIAKRGILWKLLRPCYGLPEASLCWFLTVNKYLKEQGMKEVIMDPAAYYWTKDNKLKGMYFGHVDDAYYCGDQEFHEQIMKPLFEKFKMGQIMEGEFRSLGWNVKTNERGELSISQLDYILTRVSKLPMQKPRNKYLHDRLSHEHAKILRSAIGVLRWLADQTRPDIAHAVLVLNTMQLEPTWREVKLFNATVDKVQRQPVEIIYRKLEPTKWFITIWCDASHNSINNRTGSVGAYLIFLSNGFVRGERRKCCLLSWRSKKIRRVCRSSTEAETITMSDALEEGDLIRDQIIAMTGMAPELIQMEVFCDAQNTLANIDKNTPPEATIPYRNEMIIIKDLLDSGKVRDARWVSGEIQMADSLTKLGAGESDLLETLNKGKFFN